MIGQLNTLITRQINELLLYRLTLNYVVNFINQHNIKSMQKSERVVKFLKLFYCSHKSAK